ncbi:MAG: hypothetical protein ACI9YT_001696 [Halobacteriales archaeon]|jgi:hypothetical protein
MKEMTGDEIVIAGDCQSPTMSTDEMVFEGLRHTGSVIDQSGDPPER